MNNIVIELHPEDRARLDAIIAGLDKLQPVCDSCVEHVVHLFEGQSDAPSAPAEARAPVADSVPSAEPPSLADFQKAVAERCAANPAIKPKVRELVSRYAGSVSEIPEDKRNEFLALLATV